MDKFKLYVDMDGVLAEFNEVTNIDELYEKNYFANLQPIDNVVDAIKEMIRQQKTNNDIDIYILSSVLKDSPYAYEEKNAWLEKHLPEIDSDHRIFLDYGQNKTDVIQNFDHNCVLLDDYTPNLAKWNEMGGISIKLINSINNRSKSWRGTSVEHSLNPILIAYTVKRIMIEEYVKKFDIKLSMKTAKQKLEMQKQKKDISIKSKKNELSGRQIK